MKIYVAGHRGMVGSSILRKLQRHKGDNPDLELLTRTHEQLDLTEQSAVRDFMEVQKPNLVIIAAAKVGGIYANSTYPAEFIYQNLMIQNNLIHSAYCAGVTKALFLGSSCIYPRSAEQPMSEKALLTGLLEPTNEPYAIAKIAGIKMCESYNRQYGVDFRSVMPTNLYGPGDNFHPANSHVIPAIIRRLHEAKESNSSEVVIWGTGSPFREFLHVDDMASACLHIAFMEKDEFNNHIHKNLSHVNIGTGSEITIVNLVNLIAKIVGFKGTVSWDKTKPDGTYRKLMDSNLLNDMGWVSSITLEDGLKDTYQWFLRSQKALRK